MTYHYQHTTPFILEQGAILAELNIAYHTFGKLNRRQNNVIWVCHAFTGDANAAVWWNIIIGEGKLFDPNKYFIVCANMLGSCYGTTGPATIDPATGQPYAQHFPDITIRDMVNAYELLRQHLGIEKIKLVIGGSMGGQQALEWTVMQPHLFEYVCVIAANAKHSPWGIAFNETQRMAIEADNTLYDGTPEAGKKGLEAARAIGMLSYRHYDTYAQTQADESDRIAHFRAASYQRYQGNKLWKRFNVFSYLTLTKAMDSHNVGRGRGGVAQALAQVTTPLLSIGIHSDILFPVQEQRLIAHYAPNARFELIDSLYGHDGFLVEYEKLNVILDSFLSNSIHVSSHINGMDKKVYPGMEQF